MPRRGLQQHRKLLLTLRLQPCLLPHQLLLQQRKHGDALWQHWRRTTDGSVCQPSGLLLM